jgi:hypothetical protein
MKNPSWVGREIDYGDVPVLDGAAPEGPWPFMQTAIIAAQGST